MFWFGRRQPLVEDDLQWKTTFSGRRPLVDRCMLPAYRHASILDKKNMQF